MITDPTQPQFGPFVNTEVNIYCDESCHLEHDRQNVMVIGAIWCPTEKARQIADEIRQIKKNNGISETFEIKWAKVSPGKQSFYLDLVDYLFSNNDLHFRALIVPDKTKLDHARFGQDHDTWYYKMYFDMLKGILDPLASYRIYIDIKDTRSTTKMTKLHDVLCNSMYDFERNIIERVQTVRSHEIEQLQLADLFIGIISYVNRGKNENPAKLALIKRMQEKSGYSLTKSNLLRENKVNLFIWQARENQE